MTGESADPDHPTRRRFVLSGALGVVVGALVGGTFTLGGTMLTLQNQAHREDEARQRLAAGTARVMVANLDNAVRRLCQAGRHRGQEGDFDVTPKLRPEASTADRTLVVGELSSAEAVRFSDGDQAMAHWELLYPEWRRKIRQGEEFDPRKQGLHLAVTRAMFARSALEREAGYRPDDERVICDLPPHDWIWGCAHARLEEVLREHKTKPFAESGQDCTSKQWASSESSP